MNKDIRHYTAKFRVDQVSAEKDADGADVGVFHGYASVFNEYIPSYEEIVDPGAFKQTLNHNGGGVPVLWMHGGGFCGPEPVPIGMGQDAREDEYGLHVTAKLDLEHNGEARKTWGFMKLAQERGRSVGLSIGFIPVQEEYIYDEAKDTKVRHIKEVRLMEYSITPPDWQAGPSAGVTAMRSQADLKSLIIEVLKDKDVRALLAPNAPEQHTAPEAAETTRGATDTDEARLHSLMALLNRSLD